MKKFIAGFAVSFFVLAAFGMFLLYLLLINWRLGDTLGGNGKVGAAEYRGRWTQIGEEVRHGSGGYRIRGTAWEKETGEKVWVRKSEPLIIDINKSMEELRGTSNGISPRGSNSDSERR